MSPIVPQNPLSKASIIIATSMEHRRAASLRRAIESVFQSPCVSPLLVVIGPRVDEGQFRYWSKHGGVHIERLPVGDYLKAREHGRKMVSTPYFGFLDDDDYLEPNAITSRLDVLEADATLAAVISSGVIRRNGQQFDSLEFVPNGHLDALRLLADRNWLPSAAGLYRSSHVGAEYFEHEDRHLEWTALALRMCSARLRLAFLPSPGFVIEDSPGSLSKSAAYQFGLTSTLRNLVRLPLPRVAHRTWRAKYANSLHDLSVQQLALGQRWTALATHIRSMSHPGGLRFLTYTRHILLPPKR